MARSISLYFIHPAHIFTLYLRSISLTSHRNIRIYTVRIAIQSKNNLNRTELTRRKKTKIKILNYVSFSFILILSYLLVVFSASLGFAFYIQTCCFTSHTPLISTCFLYFHFFPCFFLGLTNFYVM